MKSEGWVAKSLPRNVVDFAWSTWGTFWKFSRYILGKLILLREHLWWNMVTVSWGFHDFLANGFAGFTGICCEMYLFAILVFAKAGSIFVELCTFCKHCLSLCGIIYKFCGRWVFCSEAGPRNLMVNRDFCRNNWSLFCELSACFRGRVSSLCENEICRVFKWCLRDFHPLVCECLLIIGSYRDGPWDLAWISLKSLHRGFWGDRDVGRLVGNLLGGCWWCLSNLAQREPSCAEFTGVGDTLAVIWTKNNVKDS